VLQKKTSPSAFKTDLAELDRFCDALLAIRGEIDDVGSGKVKIADSPLRNAPHTAGSNWILGPQIHGEEGEDDDEGGGG
jgi:hypothetical protein